MDGLEQTLHPALLLSHIFVFHVYPYIVSYRLRSTLRSVLDTASDHTMGMWMSFLEVASQKRHVHVHVIVCFHHLESGIAQKVFIGPESDHWLCLSLTHSLTP